MNQLTEYISRSAEIEQKLIESDGLITPEIENLLMVKDFKLPTEVDKGFNLVLKLEASADYYRKLADKFAKLYAGCNIAIDRIKTNVKTAMIENNINELSGEMAKFNLRPTNPSLKIDNKDVIPPEYRDIIPATEEINKKRILQDLKLGVPVEGCSLTENKALFMTIKKAGK